MCKITGISSISGFTPDELAEFLCLFHKLSVPHADDGFGFAFRRAQGISVSRWVDPTEFCVSAEAFQDRAAGSALVAHARRATGAVSLANTHPFVDDGVALVHNGIVHRVRGELRHSTCDSEHILQAFIEGGQPEIEQSIYGYYAYMAIDRQGALHVARDDRAMLWMLALPSRSAYVFATDYEFLDALPWKGDIGEVAPLSYRCVRGCRIASVRRFAAPRWRQHGAIPSHFAKMADVAFS